MQTHGSRSAILRCPIIVAYIQSNRFDVNVGNNVTVWFISPCDCPNIVFDYIAAPCICRQFYMQMFSYFTMIPQLFICADAIFVYLPISALNSPTLLAGVFIICACIVAVFLNSFLLPRNVCISHMFC